MKILHISKRHFKIGLLIVAVIAVWFIGVVGYIFLNSILSTQSSTNTGSIELGKEYRFSKNQSALIGDTDDSFKVNGFTAACPKDLECQITPSVYWTITTSSGKDEGSGSMRENDYQHSTTPPSKYNVIIKDTDYKSYAVIKIVQNDNWEQKRENYISQPREKTTEEKEATKKATQEVNAKMANAKSAQFGQTFTVHPGDVYKLVNGTETYFLEGTEPSEFVGPQFNYRIYNDVISAESNDSFDGFVRPSCPGGYRPGPLTDKFMVTETDYKTYAKIIASDSLPEFNMDKCG